MFVTADFTFDRKAFDKLNLFMTDRLEAEIKKSCARGLRALGAGTVRTVIKKLSARDGFEEILQSGITYAPKKSKRIEQLEPMRIAIGINRNRRLHGEWHDAKSKPFVIRTLETGVAGIRPVWYRDENGYRRRVAPKKLKGFAVAQRKTRERLPIHVIVSGREVVRQMNVFKYLVTEYVDANYDKLMERQVKQFEKRVAKF